MIFLAIEEADVCTSLLAATEILPVVPTTSRQLSAVDPSEAALAEERLKQIHLQAGDE